MTNQENAKILQCPIRSVGILVTSACKRRWFSCGSQEAIISAIRRMHGGGFDDAPEIYALNNTLGVTKSSEFQRWLKSQDYVVIWHPNEQSLPEDDLEFLNSVKVPIYLVTNVRYGYPSLIPWADALDQYGGEEVTA